MAYEYGLNFVDGIHLDCAVRRARSQHPIGGSPMFWRAKRCFDIIVSLAMLPALGVFALTLLVLNPSRNPGPLIFVQTRMGRNGAPFRMIKFRSMTPAAIVRRGHEAPMEQDRVTPLGNWLRVNRIDELPQIINVLKGEMSLIGPRPDYIEHARVFAGKVRGYSARHVVRPGISGYAQVHAGYAEGLAATIRKARLDNIYIQKAGWRTEINIILRTVKVLRNCAGAK